MNSGRAKTIIVLQARMGSRRLPGKALATIGQRSLLGHAVVRLRQPDIAPVIVATTTEPADDAVDAEARRHGAQVLRGPRDHVLERVILLAREVGATKIIRATADNPAVDGQAAERVLASLERGRADYAVEYGLPYGCAVEAVTVAALEQALACSPDAYDHEHVTSFVVRNADRFRVVKLLAPSAVRRPDLRFTVDTREDLLYMREVFAAADNQALPGLLRAADRVGRLSELGAA
ncbi:MAG: NTP transferase domain-containing protein [Acidobacteria bacterium]|nr:NTP transferase domain-containing protein [Acidobacteriota bacterium]